MLPPWEGNPTILRCAARWKSQKLCVGIGTMETFGGGTSENPGPGGGFQCRNYRSGTKRKGSRANGGLCIQIPGIRRLQITQTYPYPKWRPWKRFRRRILRRASKLYSERCRDVRPQVVYPVRGMFFWFCPKVACFE